MTKQFKIGERVCIKQNSFVYTIVKVNMADLSTIKLNENSPWVLSDSIRYATEKEIKIFDLKQVFNKKMKQEMDSAAQLFSKRDIKRIKRREFNCTKQEKLYMSKGLLVYIE